MLTVIQHQQQLFVSQIFFKGRQRGLPRLLLAMKQPCNRLRHKHGVAITLW
jgi:hypothetical protein